MEKNPETCKNSVCVCGIYICTIEQIPCSRCKKCALEKIDNMRSLMAELITMTEDAHDD